MGNQKEARSIGAGLFVITWREWLEFVLVFGPLFVFFLGVVLFPFF